LISRSLLRLAVILFSAGVLCSCGGKIAKTGVGFVGDVNDCGVFRLSHTDGSQSWKRLQPDSSRQDFKTVQQNTMKPAKYVETPKGGTLTFQDGSTVVYQDIK
jgi:hypothetical protein